MKNIDITKVMEWGVESFLADMGIRIGRLSYPPLMLLTRIKVKYRIRRINDPPQLGNQPVIYAANHFSFSDIPIVLRSLRRHCCIFAGRQRLAFEDWLFFVLNGIIWVDRKDRADMAKAKERILKCLRSGVPVLWFPEGTWNLTENQLMLPMKWGIVDVARQSGAQIVPVGLDYDRNEMMCSMKLGVPIGGEALKDKGQAIRQLRDAMATMRWEYMEQKGVFCRAELDMEAERKTMRYSIEEYPPIDWAYERSCIFLPCAEPAEVFEHLEKLTPRKENAFLFRRA